MKKIVKICLLSFILVGIFACVFCGTFVTVQYLKYSAIPLNTESLSDPSLSVEVYSFENRPVKEENQITTYSCKLETLNPHTKEAFISIEDKEFYNHKGINKKRIAKAMVNNIKSMSLKEGASTISQQLIKNTHLSSETTFERKLKEMALTKKLEKNYSKDEILESYLNVIFFGNNCYGLESASQYYFGKSAKELDLSESCTLAGIIKSPSRYSPILHYDNCLKRRNLVLSEMEKDGKITTEEKLTAEKQPITLHISQPDGNKLNSYSQASIDEASKILNLSAKQIAIGGYHIHTYLNEEKQNALKTSLSQEKLDDIDNAGIVIDPKTYGVTAFYGNSKFKVMDIKRQPASCLKPLLVYAPALNEDVITPSTQILDEPINISGYQPTNVNKKFSGYMSVTDAVKNSINIPAIKVLSYIGIDTGKQYAEKLGIEFDEKDTSYTLALGGMTYGVNLKTLASGYSVFVNNGDFEEAKFVQYITDKDGKLVYIHKPNPQMVMREDSTYLMTNILQETAKTGTARKLSDITNTEIASKTGTVGKKNASGNTDAYNISYTPTEVVGVWFGTLDNTPVKIAGGNQPTNVVKSYIKTQNYEKTTFDIPSSVTTAKIDSLEKEENHRLVLASPYAPERYTEECLFSRFNMPSDISENFMEKPQIYADCKVENNQIVVTLSPQKHLEYQIYKDDVPYQNIKDKHEKLTLRINFPENKTNIKILTKYANSDNDKFENEKSFTLSKSQNSKPKPKTKWYI